MEAERCYNPIPKAEDQAQAVKPLVFLHLMMVCTVRIQDTHAPPLSLISFLIN